MNQCPYCQERAQGYFMFGGHRIDEPLFQTENFWVFSGLGQIEEGYVLIATLDHYIGISDAPADLYPELEHVISRVMQEVSAVWRAPLVFEHGAISDQVHDRVGGCIVHGHLHVMPTVADVIPDLIRDFEGRHIESLEELKHQRARGIAYFFVQTPSGERWLFDVPRAVPSQYIRRLVAQKVGRPERAEWGAYPGIDELLRTQKLLASRFR